MVVGGEPAQRREDVGLAARRGEVQGVVTDRPRQGLVEEVVERVDAERGEHVAELVGVRADVAPDEVIGGCRGKLARVLAGVLVISGSPVRGGNVGPHAVVGT